MALTNVRKRFCSLSREVIHTGRVRQMANYTQHGTTTTLDHTVAVAFRALTLARGLRLHVDEHALVRGGILHDFYLYDWHGSGWRHSYRHPLCASRNAQARFGISERTASAIESHMWPIGITRPPRTREAVVLCIADKYCALLETLLLRKEAKSLCR